MAFGALPRKLRRAIQNPKEIQLHIERAMDEIAESIRHRDPAAFLYLLFDIPFEWGHVPFLPRGHMVTRDIQGVEMVLDLRDRGLSRDLLIHRIREPVTTVEYKRALEAISESGKTVTVLDVGANIGYYALMPVAVLGDGAKIHAIEPDPFNVKMLRRSIEMNGFTNVVPHQCGLGDMDEERLFHISKYRNLNTFSEVRKDQNEYGESMAVQVLRGDTFIERNDIDPESIKVIRMDVEGYEAKVIEGLESVIHGADEMILNVEVHSDLLTDAEMDYLVDTLVEAGFSIRSAAIPHDGNPSTNPNAYYELRRDMELGEIKESGAVELLLEKGNVA